MELKKTTSANVVNDAKAFIDNGFAPMSNGCVLPKGEYIVTCDGNVTLLPLEGTAVGNMLLIIVHATIEIDKVTTKADFTVSTPEEAASINKNQKVKIEVKPSRKDKTVMYASIAKGQIKSTVNDVKQDAKPKGNVSKKTTKV